MTQRLFAAAVALLFSGLFACGGQPGGQATSQGPERGTAQQPSGAQPSNQPAPSTNGITIGVQPVENTAVAEVATGTDHAPLTPSPAVADDPWPAPASYSTTIWVDPNGSDSNDGTEAAPVRTITAALHLAKPGTRIAVKPGTYAEQVLIDSSVAAGTPDQKITLEAEGAVKLTPEPDKKSMVEVQQPDWVIDGFEIDVQGEPRYAVAFSGNTDGSVLSNSKLHDGSLGGGVTTFGNAHGVTVLNNEIFHFWRDDKDSHGIVIQPTSKDITIRNNDIHDNSGDSVQCLGPEGFSDLPPAEGITIEDNLLYNSRENAVDIKTCHDVTVKHNRMHTFHANPYAKDGTVVVIHMSAKDVHVIGNEIYDGGKGIALGGNHDGPVPNGVVIEKNRIHDMKQGPDMPGVGIRIENSEGAKVLDNTLSALDGAGLILGKGTGGATSNLTVRNNVIDDPFAVDLGGQAPGLKMDHNLYPSGAHFQGPNIGGAADVGAWQSLGLDADALEVATPLADPTAQTPDAAAVDKGADTGVPFCGAAPDLGAVETGC